MMEYIMLNSTEQLRRPIPPTIELYNWSELAQNDQKLHAIAQGYIRSFAADPKWQEHHHTEDSVIQHIRDELNRSPKSYLLTLERKQTGEVIAAGWQGGGVESYGEMSRWLFDSFETIESAQDLPMFPPRKAVEKKVIAALKASGVSPEKILHTVDFFTIPEEQTGLNLATGRLMAAIYRNATDRGLTHYIGWTEPDPPGKKTGMHTMMLSRGAQAIAHYHCLGKEYDVLFGNNESFMGRVNKRVAP